MVAATSPIVLARFHTVEAGKSQKEVLFENNEKSQDGRVALVDTDHNRLLDITGLNAEGVEIRNLQQVLDWTDRLTKLRSIQSEFESSNNQARIHDLNSPGIVLDTPIPRTMPVHAAGVTYLTSVQGRNDEQAGNTQSGSTSTKPKANLVSLVDGFRERLKKIWDMVNGAGANSNATINASEVLNMFKLKDDGSPISAYDLVFKENPETGRPEVFHKADPGAALPSGANIGIRSDSQWNAPEAELVLVYNSQGDLVGFTGGNDVSSRDIEGQNPLYLPQAKEYYGSTAIGQFLVLADEAINEKSIKDNRSGWKVNIEVHRDGTVVHQGETSISSIKNSFENLRSHLYRNKHLPNGAALFTGTGIVPGENFTLKEGDVVKIKIGLTGVLENKVKTVPESVNRKTAKQFAMAV